MDSLVAIPFYEDDFLFLSVSYRVSLHVPSAAKMVSPVNANTRDKTESVDEVNRHCVTGVDRKYVIYRFF